MNFSHPPKKMIDDIKHQLGEDMETWITYDNDDGRPTYHWKRKEEKVK